MFYKQLLSLLFILPPLLFSSCDENIKITLDTDKEPELPPITMEGKQTFGCLLNGEVWVRSPTLFRSNLTGYYSSQLKMFFVQASIRHNGILTSSITFSANVDTLGTYDFKHLSHYTGLNFIREDFIIEEEDHFVEITHLDQNIISGLFHFSLLDTLSGDTLRFSKGRFDFSG